MQMLLNMEEGECNTNLVLAIGGRQFVPHKIRPHGWKNTTLQFDALFPYPLKEEERSASRSKYIDEEEVISGKEPSSCSNDKLVKARKKLKLTKEQVTLLEDSFREHNTLNTAEKQELADRLNIQSRQVEVWFQNRRARTKLKQIEVDYECLKRCCESLSDENRRLKEELQELKSASPGSPFHKHFLEPAPQLLGVSKCPSCGRMGMGKLVPAVNVRLVGPRK